MQQFFSLSWSLFTAEHVSGVFPSIIRSSMTAVAASGFTFVSWWHSCCVRGRAFSRPSSGAQWLQWQPLVLPSYRGDSRAVFVVGRFPAHHQELDDCSGSLWFYLSIVVTFVLCSWSGVFPPIIRSSMTAVAASGFTLVSWWHSCCYVDIVRPQFLVSA